MRGGAFWPKDSLPLSVSTNNEADKTRLSAHTTSVPVSLYVSLVSLLVVSLLVVSLIVDVWLEKLSPSDLQRPR